MPEPRLELDVHALDGLAEPDTSRAEAARVEPGRYPLRAWAVWCPGADGGDAPALAEAVAAALTTIAVEPQRLPALADRLAELFTRRPPLGLEAARAERVVEQLRPHVAAGA